MEDHLPVLRVFLQGSFRLELAQPDGTARVIDDFEAVLGRGLSATLFKLLLCQPERRVKRDLLIRAMWPGQTFVSVRKSLDVTKSQLSRTLEQLCGRPLLPRVSGDPPIYAIVSQSLLWTDLDACEEAIRQALATRDSVASLAHWECAYRFMQRGELLADDITAYWYSSPLVQNRHTQLAKQRIQCVTRIADLSLECGNISRALEVLTQTCETDPAHEDLAFHLMNTLARLSRYPEALARYTQLEAALEARGTVPRAETKHLALWLRASASTKRWSPAEIGVEPSLQEPLTDETGRQALLLPAIQYARSIDWGEAPQVKALYGRDQELTTLLQWIVNEHAHLVAIIGMAGIGKTSLTVALIEQIHATFHTIIWRSLQNALPFQTFLRQCIETLSEGQQTDLPETLDDQISLLLSYLRTDRCLLVLDNLESILQSGKHAGEYREGYEGYGRLITRIGESKHQSCLLLTSREKPREVANLEATHSPVRAFCLKGLSTDDGMQILKDKGVQGEEDAQTTLISLYAGNPLALKLVSQYIVEVFHGEITAFLRDGEVIFSDIQEVLDQQFVRLSPLEQDILYWLAIEREAVSLHTLYEDLVRPTSRKELQEALRSLRRRNLMEAADHGFILQNVVMEYLTDRLIAQICEEISTESLALLNSHALIKAQAKDYVRESQVHLIVQPIGERLLATVGRPGCEILLQRILSQFRSRDTQESSYVAGNILNLLIQLGYDLRGHDFSSLEIRQAYLQGATLPEVNFAFSRLLNCVFTEPFGSILSVSLGSNGQQIAAGTTNGEIRQWQTFDGTPLFHYVGHTGWVWSVAFNPSGTLLASGSEDETVRIWDTKTGQCLHSLRGHRNRVRSVTFNPDGTLLASGSEDQTVRIWNTCTGECVSLLHQCKYGVRSVTFSPDGKMLAIAGDTPTIWLWDMETNTCRTTLQGHTKQIWSVTFSSCGNFLASGGDDQMVRVWDVKAGHCLHVLQGHVHRIWSVVFNSDRNVLASGSEDQTIRLWDIKTGHCIHVLQGHTNRVWSIAFDSNRNLLASGGDDQTIRLWDTRTGYCMKTLQGHTNWIWSIAVSPDGDTIATCNEDLTLRLRQVNLDTSTQALHGHRKRIRSAAFSPDGHLVASSSEDQTIRLWDVKTGRCIKTFFEPEHAHHLLPTNFSLSANRVWSVAFSPDGKVIASGNEDHKIRLWDVKTGYCLRTLQGHNGWIWSIAFSPDGNRLASGGEDTTVRLWNVNTGECLGVLSEHRSRIWSVAFSPHRNIVASGGDDHTILLWDTKTHQLLHTLQGHTYHVRSLAFSPDGHVLASGSEDETIRLWDMDTYRCLHTLRGHNHRVLTVAFCASKSNILFSGSHDETVRLWDVQTGQCLKILRNERPYENIQIADVQGLTETQKESLRILGAIE